MYDVYIINNGDFDRKIRHFKVKFSLLFSNRNSNIERANWDLYLYEIINSTYRVHRDNMHELLIEISPGQLYPKFGVLHECCPTPQFYSKNAILLGLMIFA